MSKSVADRIELRGLKTHGYHGCLDSERHDGRNFVCDVTLWLDFSGTAASDELDDAVNYADITATTHGILTGTPRNFIETVATKIAEAVLADNDARAERGLPPLLHAVEMTIHKSYMPIPLNFDDAAVTARRSRKKRLA